MKLILHYAAKSAQILVASLILVWLIYLVQAIAVKTVRFCAPQRTRTVTHRTPDPARRSFRFLPDGTAHQIRFFQEIDDQGETQDIEEIYDINDKLIERSPTPKEPDNAYLSFANGFYYASDKEHLKTEYRISTGFSRTMDIPVLKDSTLQEIWRYNRKKEVFTGYDRTGNLLGSLCKEGFKPNSTTGTALGDMERYHWWQPETGHSKFLWITENNLYEIDLNKRRVDPLVDCNTLYMGSIMAQAWYTTDKTRRGYADPNVYRPLIVSQPDEHTYHLVLRDPDQSITVSEPNTWKEVGGYCRFSATKTDLFMVRYWDNFRRHPGFYYDSPKSYQDWAKEHRATKKRHWTELYKVDAQGNLEILKAFSWKETQIRDVPFMITRSWTTRRGVQCLSPGLSIMGYKQLRAQYSSSREFHEPFLFFLVKMMPQGYWDFIIPSVLFTALAFWHGRSRWTSKSQMIFWLAFVMCLNLAGLLTYLALNHTALVRCPSCHNKRGLTSDACVRCQTPLPLPEHTRPHLLLS